MLLLGQSQENFEEQEDVKTLVGFEVTDDASDTPSNLIRLCLRSKDGLTVHVFTPKWTLAVLVSRAFQARSKASLRALRSLSAESLDPDFF